MLGIEPALKEAFIKSGKMNMVFNPVLNHGDRSYQTHQAVECAGDQDQFWPFREFLFENQGRLWSGDIRETVKQLAAEFGLDTAEFNLCLDEQRYYDRVEAQDTLRRERGIRAQPMFDIDGSVQAGSAPFETFAAIIEAKIAEQ